MTNSESTDQALGSPVWDTLAIAAFAAMVAVFGAHIFFQPCPIWRIALVAFVSSVLCSIAYGLTVPEEDDRRGVDDVRSLPQALGTIVSLVVFLLTLAWWGAIAWPWF